MSVPTGSYVSFFPPDTRSSDEKRALIESVGAERLQEMESPGFATFGYEYWDKPGAKAGYAGYVYDGRYRPVAAKMVAHYGLGAGDRLLEIGCGKGHVLVEFARLGLDVLGIDASEYATASAQPEIRDSVRRASVLEIELPDGSFDLVLAKDTLPHLDEVGVEEAVRRCERWSRRHCFFEIEVARTPYEAEMLYRWDVTHRTRRPPEWWLELFDRVGYTGDFHFKVLVEDPELPPLD